MTTTQSQPPATKAPRQARRVFDAAYKLQVAIMVREQGVSLNKVCTDMNLVPSAVRRWVAQLDAELAGNPGLANP